MTPELREVLRQLPINAIPAIGGRVYNVDLVTPQEIAALRDLGQDFILLRVLTERPGPAWGAGSATVEYWLYTSRKAPVVSHGTLDAYMGALVAALDETRITDAQGRPYRLEYAGTGPAPADDSLGALTRLVRFTLTHQAWSEARTYHPDPVVGLADAVKAMWPQLGVDPENWEATETNPAVYFRIQTIDKAPSDNMAGMVEQRAVIFGHVLAPTANTRETWVRRIQEFLARTSEVVVPDGANTYGMFLDRVGLNNNANPDATGQIRIEATFYLDELAADDTPYINHAWMSGAVSGDAMEVPIGR